MTEVIVSSHKEINALAFRHSKNAASRTVLYLWSLGVELIIEQVCYVLEEFVETLTGTKTALFQFGDVFPARFLWYISLINEEMLLKVYVLYVEL